MTTLPDGSAPTTPHPWRASARRWRFATPAIVAACGALFAVSAINSHGTDLRPGRYVGLSGLVESDKQQVDALQAEAASLQSRIGALTKQVPDADVRNEQARLDALRPAAGLGKVSGPGLEIVMSDAPPAIANHSDLDANLFVVHQQDLQAVVNALWTGGATAVTLQGQRIISTTGIKCSGSTVQLGGVPYPSPYVIQAVGDQAKLRAALEANTDVALFRQQSAMPDIALGWSLSDAAVNAPAYAGAPALSYATPAAS